jgi:hypothetical protein
VDRSDSEEEAENDVDEEAMYAELGDQLTFEHNGMVMSLKSASDLAAWREQRRKNWPTKSRMNEKMAERHRIGEERRRLLSSASLLEDDRCVTGKERKTASDRPGSGANEQPLSKLDQAKRELREQEQRLKALRRQVARGQAGLEKAQAAMADEGKHTKATLATAEDGELDEGKDDDNDDNSDVSSVLSESSSVVSSDSSEADSDDDGPPEEATSKAPELPESRSQRPVCRFYYASGHCRDGKSCKYQHELGPGIAKVEVRQKLGARTAVKHMAQDGGGRKGIYDRLLEQQQEEEDELALKVIKYLGKVGFFASAEESEGRDGM